jgi:hypothetical protein
LRGASRASPIRGRCITVGNASRDDTRPDVQPLAPGNPLAHRRSFLGAELAFKPTVASRPMIERHLGRRREGNAARRDRQPLPASRRRPRPHARVEGREAFGRVVLLP